jgi:hypothetical protein
VFCSSSYARFGDLLSLGDAGLALLDILDKGILNGWHADQNTAEIFILSAVFWRPELTAVEQ